jgi:hypothetical protein
MTNVLVLGLMAFFAAEPTVKEKFAEVQIEKPFDKYLLANPLLMEVTGAKIIRLESGEQVVMSVASTVLKDHSAKERLRAQRVCRARALVEVVAATNGVRVCHEETVKDKTQIVFDRGKESGNSVSQVLQITKTKVEGIAQNMPVVGTWKSKERDVLYLAVGVICDREGNPASRPPR